MEQGFKAGYMIKLDQTFEFHETKFHRVVWALDKQIGAVRCYQIKAVQFESNKCQSQQKFLYRTSLIYKGG